MVQSEYINQQERVEEPGGLESFGLLSFHFISSYYLFDLAKVA